MYPTISDMLKDLFGINILLPIQTFGFFLALALLIAAYILNIELKRKEKNKILKPIKESKIIGEKVKISQIISALIIGFIIGFKLFFIILNYRIFALSPQSFIFSSDGNIPGGIIFAIINTAYKYYEVNKNALPEPKKITEEIFPHQLVATITFIAAISGIIGAKIFDNLEHIDTFIQDPVGSLFSFSGLSIFGGIIFGSIAIIIFAKRKKIPVIHLADAVAPALIIGYAIGRIGCQMAGDGDWGIPNDIPKPKYLSFLPDWLWAYDYPNNVLGVDLKDDFIKMGYQSKTGNAWPTPIYETIMSFIIFIFLWLIRKKIKTPGILFSIYLFMAGIERLLIEQIRVNPKYHFLGIAATQAEIISVLFILTGIAGIFYFKRKNNSFNYA